MSYTHSLVRILESIFLLPDPATAEPPPIPICSDVSAYYEAKFADWPFERTYISGEYSGTLRRDVLAYKYNRDTTLTKPLARRLARLIRDTHSDIALADSLVTTIPVHPWDTIRRYGYRPAHTLTRAVARELGISYMPLGRKVRLTPHQALLERSERLDNLHDAFRINTHDTIHILAEQHILLIDDVLSTGATAYEFGSRLREIYPDVPIRAYFLARGGGT